MKKNRRSQSGIFTPRAILGFFLCLVGISLAVVSLAAPRASSRTRADRNTSARPTVSSSVANGVSQAVRDLPAAGPITRNYVEHELPPVKPFREMPQNFVDQVLQTALGPLAIPTTNVSFEGMTQEEACGGCIPPDTTGAIGPSQYVQMTNSALSVYRKNGTRLSGPTPINQLFASLPADNACRVNNNGDPIVVYDQLADRWLVSQFAVPGGAGPNGGYHECIAISQSGDATGAYYLYDFFLSSTRFEDYPHIGLWPDGYYMMTHGFNTAGTAYLGAGAYAFERAKMLVGQPAQLVFFVLAGGNTSYGGHLPANLDGFTLPPAGAPNYFAEVDNAADFPATGAAMRIWKFKVDWTNPANSTFGVTTSGVPNSPNFIVPVADFVRPPCSLAGNRVYVMGCVPQLGDPSQLDPIGDRLMFRLAYRNFGDHEALVLNHTVVANTTTGQMGPRWYEVRDPGGTPLITQQSTFAPAGPTDPYRFLGSIAMDRAGDIAIGYSASSLTQFPSINYAGRLVGDPVNSLAQGEGVLQAGQGAQHGEAFAPQTGRWGDYSTMTVDPYDDCTFWYTNEYFPAADMGTATANWHTRVGSFKFPSCTPRPIGLLSGTVVTDPGGNPIAGAKVTAGGYTAFTGNGGVYQFAPLTPGTYTVTASATGYFPSSVSKVVIEGNNRQDFALMRNMAEPTPAPPPLANPLQNVNPPVLNDPGTTTTKNNYPVTWMPAEVTAGLARYVLEESTDYVVSLFDNADAVGVMPGDATSPWTKGDATNPWIQNSAYFHSAPTSYFNSGEGSFGADSSLTLKNPITIPASVGSARLNFWSRFYNDGDDTGNVEVSTGSFTNWTTLRSLLDAPMVPPANIRMQNQELDLTAYKGVPMKLRFRFSGGSLVYFLIRTLGWWVDDILVDGATWTPVATTPGNTTSTQIINKPSGRYYYRVRGIYSDGSPTAFSNVQDIIVNTPPAPAVVSVVSTKNHAGTDFTIPLTLTDPPVVECRTGGSGGNHTLVFTFASPVTVDGNPKAQVTSGTGTVSSVMVNGTKVTVNLTGVANAQRITVTLFSVNDQTNSADVSVPMYLLAGDTNGDTRVNVGDTNQTKGRSGQITTQDNVRSDVNVDGRINVGDVNFVKAQAGFEP